MESRKKLILFLVFMGPIIFNSLIKDLLRGFVLFKNMPTILLISGMMFFMLFLYLLIDALLILFGRLRNKFW